MAAHPFLFLFPSSLFHSMYLFKIGFTHGDINGIGCEMLIKVLQDPEMLEFCTPVIFGSAQVLRQSAQQLGISMIPLNIVPRAADAIEGRINLVPVCDNAEPEIQFGQQTEASLQAEANSLNAALEASLYTLKLPSDQLIPEIEVTLE